MTNKTLAVVAFFAVILFFVLIAVLAMVNKSENYRQTQSIFGESR